MDSPEAGTAVQSNRNGGIMEDTLIKQFLAQYKLWALAGAPEESPYGFSTVVGLCANLARYASTVLYGVAEYHMLVDEAYGEFQALFQADGLDADYPFGEDEYIHDHLNRSFHLNPARMAWVDQQLGLV